MPFDRVLGSLIETWVPLGGDHSLLTVISLFPLGYEQMQHGQLPV